MAWIPQLSMWSHLIDLSLETDVVSCWFCQNFAVCRMKKGILANLLLIFKWTMIVYRCHITCNLSEIKSKTMPIILRRQRQLWNCLLMFFSYSPQREIAHSDSAHIWQIFRRAFKLYWNVNLQSFYPHDFLRIDNVQLLDTWMRRHESKRLIINNLCRNWPTKWPDCSVSSTHNRSKSLKTDTSFLEIWINKKRNQSNMNFRSTSTYFASQTCFERSETHALTSKHSVFSTHYWNPCHDALEQTLFLSKQKWFKPSVQFWFLEFPFFSKCKRNQWTKKGNSEKNN